MAAKKPSLRIPLDDTSLAQIEKRKGKERRKRGFKGFSRRDKERSVNKRATGSRLRIQKR